MTDDTTSSSGRDAAVRLLLRRPPGWILHTVVGLAAVLVLYATSSPAASLTAGIAAAVALVAVVVVWALRLGFYLRTPAADRGTGATWVFVVIPVVVVLVVGALVTDAPLRARFGAAKGDFEAAVDAAPPGTEGRNESFEPPDRIGSYDIGTAFRRGDTVVFEVSGGFFTTVGFAYLPDGTFPPVNDEKLADPDLTSLGDDWYAYSGD